VTGVDEGLDMDGHVHIHGIEAFLLAGRAVYQYQNESRLATM
jgi:hypothetical protein